MVERRRKERLPDGREVDTIEMPFQTGAEHWNEYVLPRWHRAFVSKRW